MQWMPILAVTTKSVNSVMTEELLLTFDFLFPFLPLIPKVYKVLHISLSFFFILGRVRVGLLPSLSSDTLDRS